MDNCRLIGYNTLDTPLALFHKIERECKIDEHFYYIVDLRSLHRAFSLVV